MTNVLKCLTIQETDKKDTCLKYSLKPKGLLEYKGHCSIYRLQVALHNLHLVEAHCRIGLDIQELPSNRL